MGASGVNADLRKFGTIFPEIVHSFCTAVSGPQMNADQAKEPRMHAKTANQKKTRVRERLRQEPWSLMARAKAELIRVYSRQFAAKSDLRTRSASLTNKFAGLAFHCTWRS